MYKLSNKDIFHKTPRSQIIASWKPISKYVNVSTTSARTSKSIVKSGLCEIEMLRRFVIFDKSCKKSHQNSFDLRCIVWRFSNDDNDDGISPYKLLLANDKCVNPVRSPMLWGKVPASQLPSNDREYMSP